MSYARFREGVSDVYIYHHASGFIECCGCSLTEPEGYEWVGFAKLNTGREALEHLERHREAGHLVPDGAFERIREEYPQLDIQVERWEMSDEQREKQKARLKQRFGKQADGENDA